MGIGNDHNSQLNYELPLLRLLSEPPSTSDQYASYIGTLSQCMATFGKFEGDHLASGVRAMVTAARHVRDASLFRSIAKLIVMENGLDLSQIAPGVETPLHAAIETFNVSAVRILLELGALLHNCSSSGFCSNSHIDGRCVDTLTLACRVMVDPVPSHDDERSTEIVKMIIEQFSRDGTSPIELQREDFFGTLYASLEGKKSKDIHEVVRLLLKAGFRANVPDQNRGRQPLHHAASHGHWKTAIELLRHGVDIEAKDAQGKTAFDCAQETGVISDELRAVIRCAQMNKMLV